MIISKSAESKMSDWRHMPRYLIVGADLRGLGSACMSAQSGSNLPFLKQSFNLIKSEVKDKNSSWPMRM